MSSRDAPTTTAEIPTVKTEAPVADLVVAPAQSAHFALNVDDEHIATAPWPRWPGVFLFALPVVLAGYLFGVRGIPVGKFFAAMEQFYRGLFDIHVGLGGFACLLTAGLALGAYAGVASLLNTSHVSFAQNMLIVDTAPLPLFRRRKSYLVRDVISAAARGHGRLDGGWDFADQFLNQQYALMLRVRGKGHTTALWNLGGKEQAKRVARAINARLDQFNAKEEAKAEEHEDSER